MTATLVPSQTLVPIVILISGAGSNMQAIAQRTARGELPLDIRAVVSDRADAAGLATANALGLQTVVHSPRGYPDRESYDAALASLLEAYAPSLIVLAGFMRILSREFVQRFVGRMLNIHPSLLPKYPGLHTHRRALAAGEREHGASVHFVTEELDGGPVALQARVPVLAQDDEATLAARVQEQEHRLYSVAIDWFVHKRLVYAEGAAWLDGTRLDKPLFIS